MTTDTAMKGLLAGALLTLAAAPAFAAGGGALPFSYKPDTTNLGSLQRGARDFMSYCSGCHSLKYLRYNRLAQDLGIPDDLLKANLMFTSDKLGDHIISAMPKASGNPAAPSQSEVWFGRAPPDLSLTARERGVDWVYSYLLTFYIDPTRPTGVTTWSCPARRCRTCSATCRAGRSARTRPAKRVTPMARGSSSRSPARCRPRITRSASATSRISSCTPPSPAATSACPSAWACCSSP